MFIIGSLIAFIATAVGTTPAGLRLVLSILAGYPLVGFYRSYVADEQLKEMHHLFFTMSGMALCILNFGNDIIHSLIGTMMTYIFLNLFRYVPEMLIAMNFLFHMIYLCIGYYNTHTDEYTITWTMPHCMLVLRMIGLSMDIVDGMKPTSELTKEQNETALSELPTLLELFAFSYFPFSFLIGPLFNFKRYKQFIHGDFDLYTGAKRAGVQRLCAGLIYMTIFEVGSHFLPNSYLLTPEFRKEILPIRILIMGVWGKVVLSKYIAVWLLVEGALICLGFTYKEKQANGNVDWSGCANVKVFDFETGLKMQHYIQSFNVGTNNWAARYVYKRLKFLNSRLLSHIGVLLFLAVWHGFHSGYYVTFLLEFFIVIAERQFEKFYRQEVMPKFGHILVESNLVWEYCHFVIMKTYDIIFMGFCMVPFTYLTFHKYTKVYGAVYYYVVVLLALWFGFFHLYERQHLQQLLQRLRRND